MKLVVSATDEDLQPAIGIDPDSGRRNKSTTETRRRAPTTRETRRLPEERQPRRTGITEEHLQESIRVARAVRLERVCKSTQTKPVGPVNTACSRLPDVTDPVVSHHCKHFHPAVRIQHHGRIGNERARKVRRETPGARAR